MFTTFTVIRHGETEANLNGVIQGQTDVPLDPVGEAQARSLGRRWKNRNFDAIYSSDLSRAMRTARIVAPDREITPVPDLREIDLGAWCGLSISEVAERFPDEWAAFRSGIRFRATGGESRMELQTRVDRFFASALARHPGGHVLVVTHGGVLRAFFRMLMGGTETEGALMPATGNTCVCVANFDSELRKWRLITWNDTAHLDGLFAGDDAR